MDRYLQDITGWRVKLNTEHSPEGVNSAHVESWVIVIVIFFFFFITKTIKSANSDGNKV